MADALEAGPSRPTGGSTVVARLKASCSAATLPSYRSVFTVETSPVCGPIESQGQRDHPRTRQSGRGGGEEAERAPSGTE